MRRVGKALFAPCPPTISRSYSEWWARGARHRARIRATRWLCPPYDLDCFVASLLANDEERVRATRLPVLAEPCNATRIRGWQRREHTKASSMCDCKNISFPA